MTHLQRVGIWLVPVLVLRRQGDHAGEVPAVKVVLDIALNKISEYECQHLSASS